MNKIQSAFTLVEVILAILIISAIMTVLLYFYHRAAEVRQAILREAEYISVSRMFLEQLSGELRAARIIEDQFIGLEGTSNSISFICTTIPQMARWIVNTNESVALPPVSDLKRVTYRLLMGTNVLDVRGLDRTEELITGSAFAAGTNATEFVRTNVVADGEEAFITTNQVESVRQPLTAEVKFLQFRYWGGTNWMDSWSSFDLPTGVEISIGRDPEPMDSTSTNQYSADIFRRVVYLPNSTPPANRIVREEAAETF